MTRVQQLEAVVLGGGVHDQAVGSDGAFSVFGVFHPIPASGVTLGATKSVSWSEGDDSILDDVGHLADDGSASASVPTACGVVREMDDMKVDAEESYVQVSLTVHADFVDAKQIDDEEADVQGTPFVLANDVPTLGGADRRPCENVAQACGTWQVLPREPWHFVYDCLPLYFAANVRERLLADLRNGNPVDSVTLRSVVETCRPFPALIDEFWAVGDELDEKRKCDFEALKSPIRLAGGSRVFVHYGLWKNPGKLLRAGFGAFAQQYRIEDLANKRESWIDIWRCEAIE